MNSPPLQNPWLDAAEHFDDWDESKHPRDENNQKFVDAGGGEGKGKYVEAAVKMFGVTDDPRRAGYILPDGRMLKWENEQGISREHSEIVRVTRPNEEHGFFYGTFNPHTIHEFLRDGSIRLTAYAKKIGVETVGRPSVEQMGRITALADRAYEVSFDVTEKVGDTFGLRFVHIFGPEALSSADLASGKRDLDQFDTGSKMYAEVLRSKRVGDAGSSTLLFHGDMARQDPRFWTDAAETRIDYSEDQPRDDHGRWTDGGGGGGDGGRSASDGSKDAKSVAREAARERKRRDPHGLHERFRVTPEQIAHAKKTYDDTRSEMEKERVGRVETAKRDLEKVKSQQSEWTKKLDELRGEHHEDPTEVDLYKAPFSNLHNSLPDVAPKAYAEYLELDKAREAAREAMYKAGSPYGMGRGYGPSTAIGLSHEEKAHAEALERLNASEFKKLQADARNSEYSPELAGKIISEIHVTNDDREKVVEAFNRAKDEEHAQVMARDFTGQINELEDKVHAGTRVEQSEVTERYFDKMGLKDVHNQISSDWVSSSSSEGAIALDAAIAAEYKLPCEGCDRERESLKGEITKATAAEIADRGNIKYDELARYTREMYLLSQATLPPPPYADGKYRLYRGIHNQSQEGAKVTTKPAEYRVWDGFRHVNIPADGEAEAIQKGKEHFANLDKEPLVATRYTGYDADSSYWVITGRGIGPGSGGGIEVHDAATADEAKARVEKQMAASVIEASYFHPARSITEPAEVGKSYHFAMRPVSSWSNKREKAADFAGSSENGIVLAENIHPSRIYSHYGLFKNTFNENEFVTLSMPSSKQRVSKKVGYQQNYDADDDGAVTLAYVLNDENEDWLRTLRKQYAQEGRRADYREDQPRDDHGRWTDEGGGGEIADRGGKESGAPPRFHNRDRLAGKTGKPPSPKQLDELGSALYDIGGHSAEEESDWDVTRSPERQKILGEFRNIVEKATGIPQKYKVEELSVAPLYGARGIFTPAHVAMTGVIPGRIRVDSEVHAAATNGLQALGGKNPESITNDQIAGINTFIHETLHTTSPMDLRPASSMYVGHGQLVEEVSNEVVARSVTAGLSPVLNDRIGIKAGRSYQHAIDDTLGYVRESAFAGRRHGSTSVPPSGMEERALLKGSHDYRALTPAEPFTRDEALHAFTSSIGRAAHAESGDINATVMGDDLKERILNGLHSGQMRVDTMLANSVFDLPRNDVAAAIAFIMSRKVGPDAMHMILMLQDDPEELLAALRTLKHIDPKHFDETGSENRAKSPVYDLQRNDMPGAMRLLMTGDLKSWEKEALVGLQDDPSDIRTAIEVYERLDIRNGRK